MAYNDIIVEKKGVVAKLTINRPPVNVLSIETLKEMNSALGELKNDPEVKVLLITGAGDRAFSAGVEVKDHIGDRMPIMMQVFPELFNRLMEVDKVTIAVVNGVALGGGCELVGGCDLAVASEKAVFAQPEMKLGTYPGIAGVLFQRLLGIRRGLEFVLSGDNIDAKEAERIGLVNKVVPYEELEKAAEEFAQRFSGLSGIVLRMARRTMYQTADLGWDEALKVAAEVSEDVMKTEDANEGLSAFVEKRKPVWKNR
ncbi:MAG: enoyl-CoA hydratase/isomerase family protein [Dehalococcoidia bacterium]